MSVTKVGEVFVVRLEVAQKFSVY